MVIIIIIMIKVKAIIIKVAELVAEEGKKFQIPQK